MNRQAPPSLSDKFASAIAWWRDAGVDLDFNDSPTNWMGNAQQASEIQGSEEEPQAPASAKSDFSDRIGGDPRNWPKSLDAFSSWWLSEESLAEGEPDLRVPPRGPARPELMVIVPEPQPGDTRRLLDGTDGTFLANVFSAMEIDETSVYLASAIPRNMPLADWEELARRGLGEVVLHHVALVAPRRVLVLGRNMLPLLAHDPATGNADFLEIGDNGNKGMIPLLASWDLATLRARAKARAGLWRRWLRWTESN